MKLLKQVLAVIALAAFAQANGKAPAKPESITNSLGMTFVAIPPGTFVMGSSKDEPGREDDETQHTVTLTKGFYLQTTEVTNAQWKAVMKSDPPGFRSCGDDCPVSSVTWDMTQAFIARLNAQDRDNTYRLPTEAEWEYAARAGTTTPFSTGDCLTTEQANINPDHQLPGCPKGQYRQRAIAVGSFPPNAWGLHDMHGNGWEMVQDWYGEYPTGKVVDPAGPKTGKYRVIRGGSWRFFPGFARSANRFKSIKDIAGFRLVLVPRNDTKPAATER